MSRNLRFIILIGALGAYLRIIDLQTFWLSSDEATYIEITRKHFYYIFEYSRLYSHPPFYFILLKILKLISDDILTYRLLSLVSAILCIPAVYYLSREIFDQQTSQIAALLMAVSPGPIMHSQIIRPYSILLLLTIISAYGLHRLQKNKTHGVLLHTLSSILGIFTHYGFGLINACFLTNILINHKIISKNKAFSLVVFHFFAFIITVSMIYYLQGFDGADYFLQLAKTSYLKDSFIKNPFHFLLSFAMLNAYFFGTHIFIISITFYLIGIYFIFKTQSKNLLVFFILPISLFTCCSIMGIYPFGGSRHSIFLYPFILLPIAFGISSISLFKNRFVLTFASAALIFYSYKGYSEKDIFILNDFANKYNLPTYLEKDRTTRWSSINPIINKIEDISKKDDLIIFTPSSWLRLGLLLKTTTIEEVKSKNSLLKISNWNKNKIIILRDLNFNNLLLKINLNLK